MESQKINSFSIDEIIQDILEENEELDAPIINTLKNCFEDSFSVESRLSDVNTIVKLIPTIHAKKSIIDVTLKASTKCLKQVLGAIGDILDRTNFEMSSPQVEQTLLENLQLCSNTLELFTLFLNNIIMCSPLDLLTVESLPKNIANILLEVFLHCKNSETMYASYFQQIGPSITKVFKKCHELQVLYFVVLTEHISIDLSHDEQTDILLEVLDIIVEIGQVVITLDVKTMAEEWKGYTKLCEQHVGWLKDKFIHHKPTEFLCNEIKKNLNSLVSQEICDAKNTMRALKISNFIMKILIKLSELFNGYLSMDLSHIVFMLYSVNQYSSPNLINMGIKKPLIEGIQSHITVGAELLLISLLRDIHFQRSFLNEIKQLIYNKSLTLGCLLSSVSILKLLLETDQEVRDQWTRQSDDNIICCLFDILSLAHIEFNKNLKFDCPDVGNVSLYDYVLIHVVALTISCQDISVVEVKMLKVILQSNIWSAMVALDLWYIMARYGSADFSFDQTTYMINTYNNLYKSGMLKDSPQNMYLSQLLCKLFSLLPNKMKLKIYKMFPVSSNIEVWTAIGVDCLPDEQRLLECENILEITTSSLKCFIEKKCKKDDYLNMVNYLQLFMSVGIDSDSHQMKVDNLINLLINAWQSVVLGDKLEKHISNKECSVQGCQWLHEHVILLCSVTLCLNDKLTNEQWTKVLKILLPYMKKSQSCIKLVSLELLKSLTHNENPDDNFKAELTVLIADMFRELLEDGSDLIRAISLESFGYFARNTSNENILPKVVGKNTLKERVANFLKKQLSVICTVQSLNMNFLELSLKAEFFHKCEKVTESQLFEEDFSIGDVEDIFTDDFEAGPRKKARINSEDNVDIVNTIGRLKTDADILKAYFGDKQASISQKTQLSSVLEILNHIIKV